MKKDSYNRLIEIAIIIMLATMLGMFSGGATIFTLITENDYKQSTDNQIMDIYNEIIENYYKDIDEQQLIDAAISGMLSTLEDPNSTYMDSTESNSFNDRLIGEYKGVGLEILNSEDGYTMIIGVFENTPGEKAGLKVGDVILSVNGNSILDIPANRVAEIIKYETDDIVDLEIRRGEDIFNVSVEKDIVIIKSVTSNIYNEDNQKIGYIRIHTFAGNTFNQLKTELEKLEKENIDSLILDVRNNSGGYLSSVADMLELFIEEGKNIYQLDTKGDVTIKKSDTKEHKTYSIVVLTNEVSASASEILAAGLQESYNATLVGKTTYGKGTVQEAITLSNGATVKITTKQWLTPNGNYIDQVGVTPDYEVEQNENFWINPNEQNDSQLQKALELLRN